MDFLLQARKTAEWVCHNQHVYSEECVPGEHEIFCMMEDMNYGRFVRNYSIPERRILHFSTNWISGMTIYGLAALYDYFKDEKYLDTAIKGSYYLHALQNTLEGDPGYGAFNERIPANRWVAPRDGISAAWGLLRLHRSSKRQEWLKRAELYANWHLQNAFVDGYPAAYVMFDKPYKDTTVYNCQGGSALFYYDLFKLTGNSAYSDAMRLISDKYLEYFLNDDGSLEVVYDPVTGQRGSSDPDGAWEDMHKFNDDFSALALIATTQATGDRKYLESAVKYLNWVVSMQQSGGGFGKYAHSVSSCVAALNLLNLYLIDGNEKYREAAMKAIAHLDASVVLAPGDPVIDGGILGMSVCDVVDNIISLRVTMYAMYLYLLAGIIEQNIGISDLPEIIVNNPMFIGLKIKKDR